MEMVVSLLVLAEYQVKLLFWNKPVQILLKIWNMYSVGDRNFESILYFACTNLQLPFGDLHCMYLLH